jgi:N-acetylmuramoyl-L-alanine amidase
MAKYNVHGGHNPAGKIACGATGLLDESKEDRLVAKALIGYLKDAGCTVYNCTVDDGTSQSNVLSKIVKKCNAHSVDMDFSVHFNSGRSDSKGDGKNGGFEVWACSWSDKKKAVANRCCKAMKELGFTNRGLKTSSSLYYLNHTTAPALLFEICFVDDKDDYKLYKNVGYKKIAKALAEAILNKTISDSSSSSTSSSTAKAFAEGEYNSTVQVTAECPVRTGRGKTYEQIGTLAVGKKVKVLYILKNSAGNYWGSIDYTNGKDGIGYICLNNTKAV